MAKVIIFALLPVVALAQMSVPQTYVRRSAPAPVPLPNTVGCYGDSIVAGACASVDVCRRISDAIAGSSVSNQAVSGYTAQQISNCYFNGVPGTCANYATQCTGEPCGTLVIQGGVNSLKAPDAVTGVESQTISTMRAIVVNALGRGRRVAWLGVLPYASCDPVVCPILVDSNQRALTYNALQNAACAELRQQYGNLVCVSPYEQFEDPPGTGMLDPVYACADGIHLRDTGGGLGPQALACDVLTALGYGCP